MSFMIFSHPEPVRAPTRIRPVFMPYLGCEKRCIYCAQHLQTGQHAASLELLHQRVKDELEQAARFEERPFELAFYGGTFTALPEPWPRRFIELTSEYREKGVITRVRCSTRPDAVSPRQLAELKGLGLDLVELGIQSFDDIALMQSGRDYAREVALAACAMVRESGLGLGIQLLPGLPGDRPGTFCRDVTLTVAQEPETVRLYPCLVLKETVLASIWKRGDYQPWGLSRARNELGFALNRLWSHGVQVIRIGLAPEDSMLEGLLAGPWHPALGQSVKALALFHYISFKAAMLGKAPEGLRIPRKYTGELMGYRGERKGDYGRIGLTREKITAWDRNYFLLY